MSQYVPQIKKKQPGSRWPLKAPCVGCRIVPGAKGAGDVAVPDISMAAPRPRRLTSELNGLYQL